jgi:hypothetical protein
MVLSKSYTPELSDFIYATVLKADESSSLLHLSLDKDEFENDLYGKFHVDLNESGYENAIFGALGDLKRVSFSDLVDPHKIVKTK